MIHPDTAEEFRLPLQAALDRLSPCLLLALAAQGYQIHVVDRSRLQPLTLEVEECPLEQPPRWALLDDGGASRPEQLEEWLECLECLNPSLDREAPADQPILVPGFRYWQGRRLATELVEFLENPGAWLGTSATVAALVLHGPLPGQVSPRGAMRLPLKPPPHLDLGGAIRLPLKPPHLLLFWEFPFRERDPLLGWYILHELGHLTEYTLTRQRPPGWQRWRARLQACFAAGPWLTDYARQDLHEFFAEGFAGWFQTNRLQGYDPGLSALGRQRAACWRESMEQQVPELCQLITQALDCFRFF